MSEEILFDDNQPDDLDLNITGHTAKKRKAFRAEWVKLPLRWVEALQCSKSASTYRLAHVILLEGFKREYVGGEIVLSSTVTNMPSTTKLRAAKELAELGLIRIEQEGQRASRIYILKKKTEQER